MEFERLVTRVVERGIEYAIVRPGVSLCLLYPEPAEVISSSIADILDKYLEFISPQTLGTYQSRDGTWKKASARTFNSIKKQLHTVGPGEHAEFHLGQEPLANVGSYGAHYEGSTLDDEVLTLQDNLLYLEFPEDVCDEAGADELLEFVTEVAQMQRFDSGYLGYAFKHLLMTFRSQSFAAISQNAMRYIGFDISSDNVRFDARGRVCNVSWVTLFGEGITNELGGVNEIRQSLPDAMRVIDLDPGVLVRASENPIVGDVNRGAEDVAPLRRLAELTRELRLEVPNLGPDDPTFAERWLNRFDPK